MVRVKDKPQDVVFSSHFQHPLSKPLKLAVESCKPPCVARGFADRNCPIFRAGRRSSTGSFQSGRLIFAAWWYRQTKRGSARRTFQRVAAAGARNKKQKWCRFSAKTAPYVDNRDDRKCLAKAGYPCGAAEEPVCRFPALRPANAREPESVRSERIVRSDAIVAERSITRRARPGKSIAGRSHQRKTPPVSGRRLVDGLCRSYLLESAPMRMP